MGLRKMIFEAGDSDTNACIVGGLLGAFENLSSLN